MCFYDSHIHKKNVERGGFIIGLEGQPIYDDTFNNVEALSLHAIENNYIAFYYVSKDELAIKLKHKYLKYHPRREKYTPKEVVSSIKINNPRAVIIDSLNEPYWKADDYWWVARECADVIVVFAHAGGYLVNDFIKICHFQRNVYLDFSLTHTMLGKLGKEEGLFYINNAIHYSLNSDFANRILLGSDYPFYNQLDVVEYYKEYVELLNKNFLDLIELIT